MARRSKFGRFQVENQASDPFKHTDVAYNLDQLDMMIGGPTQQATHGVGDDFNNPSTSAPIPLNQWLSPQDPVTIVNFGARTLYNIVTGLDYNSVPLGAVIPWWRPDAAVPLPSCFALCDGASYTGTDKHSYQAYGITTITVPDLRNKFILGANSSITDGTAAALPSVQAASGAPGIRGGGGSNVPRALAHTHTAGGYAVPNHVHQMNDHVHDAGGHTHTHSHSHSTNIDHSHGVSASGTTSGPSGTTGDFAKTTSGARDSAAGPGHTHTITVSGGTGVNGGTVTSGDASPVTTGGASGNTGTMIPGTQWAGQPVDPFTHVSVSMNVTGNSGAVVGTGLNAVETTPQYYGLLFIVKIRKASPLHNTVFPVGT